MVTYECKMRFKPIRALSCTAVCSSIKAWYRRDSESFSRCASNSFFIVSDHGSRSLSFFNGAKMLFFTTLYYYTYTLFYLKLESMVCALYFSCHTIFLKSIFCVFKFKSALICRVT